MQYMHTHAVHAYTCSTCIHMQYMHTHAVHAYTCSTCIHMQYMHTHAVHAYTCSTYSTDLLLALSQEEVAVILLVRSFFASACEGKALWVLLTLCMHVQ